MDPTARGPLVIGVSGRKSPLEELLEAEEQQANLTSNTGKERKFKGLSHDLKLGAQGYSSSSDNEQSPTESGLTSSRRGADTYAGHLTSHYDQQRTIVTNTELGSKRSIKSRAYGMEHGNWMGMDASV